MQPTTTTPDLTAVTSAVTATGTGVWSYQEVPAGLLLVLTADRASRIAEVLEASGHPTRVVSASTLIVYGADPVALIDAQIAALRVARARLESGTSGA